MVVRMTISSWPHPQWSETVHGWCKGNFWRNQSRYPKYFAVSYGFDIFPATSGSQGSGVVPGCCSIRPRACGQKWDTPCGLLVPSLTCRWSCRNLAELDLKTSNQQPAATLNWRHHHRISIQSESLCWKSTAPRISHRPSQGNLEISNMVWVKLGYLQMASSSQIYQILWGSETVNLHQFYHSWFPVALVLSSTSVKGKTGTKTRGFPTKCSLCSLPGNASLSLVIRAHLAMFGCEVLTQRPFDGQHPNQPYEPVWTL